MLNNCSFCKDPLQGKTALCHFCLNNFLDDPPKKKLGVYSLYKYEKALRQNIMAAKVANHRRSLQALLALWEQNPLSHKLANSVDFIMPAPASLWSRMRGRIDIPWFLAKGLSLKHNKQFLSPPLKLAWRKKKRAQKNRLGSSYDCSDFVVEKSQKQTVLLIDDVITTGFTMNKICLELEGVYNIKILTLAYSR